MLIIKKYLIFSKNDFKRILYVKKKKKNRV